MARTRLLCITHSMVRGGAPTSLDLLVRSLDPSRYECIIACIYPTPEIVAFHEAAGVQVIPAQDIMDLPHTTGGWLRPWNPRHVLRLLQIGLGWRHSVRAAKELIEEVQPDIVYLNSLILPTAALAARRTKTRLVWQVRESVESGLFGVRRRWYGRLLRTVPDAAIFLSQSDAKKFGSRNPNWWVVPAQSEFPEEIPVGDKMIAARRQLGLPETASVVLFLGGLSEIKGIFPLMRAVPLVRMKVPGAIFLIGGAHPRPASSRAQLKSRILALLGRKTSFAEAEEAINRAGEGVVVAPFANHPGTYLGAADILVFPSVKPHFARPVIEAFAHGVPVVASDIGGPDELIADGSTGLLVEPGNASDLAAALIRTLTDRQLRRSLAERAFLEGKERFDLRVGIAQIDRLFQEVQATGGRADARRGI